MKRWEMEDDAMGYAMRCVFERGTKEENIVDHFQLS
jgi:hypothetical protein